MGCCEIAGVVRLKRSLDFEQDEPVEPFVADHPFLWWLRDNDSGLLLFIGRLATPSRPTIPAYSPDRDEL